MRADFTKSAPPIYVVDFEPIPPERMPEEMYERQTILGIGAGASTKVLGGRRGIERLTECKYPYDYLARFDPTRVVLSIRKREGSAGREESMWMVGAASFVGGREGYGFVRLRLSLVQIPPEAFIGIHADGL